jgi:hypothetical protein
MRRFEKIIGVNRRGEEVKKPVKGLILIHIGDDVWRIGSTGVIYTPQDREIRVLPEVFLSFFHGKYNTYWRERDRDKMDPALVKIYILTSILDDRENWCFDLTKMPEPGKIVKVIYDNGTVLKKEFAKEWIPQKIGWSERNPIAWRIK